MNLELNNYNPALLLDDSTCEIQSISPEKGVAKYLNYVEVTGIGFKPTGSSTEVSSPQLLCIYESDIIGHFVTVANVIDDSNAKCTFPKNKDVPTFNLYLSKAQGSKCVNSLSLVSNQVEIYTLPQMHKVEVEAIWEADSTMTQSLTITGFHLLTMNEFGYNLKCNGFGASTPITVVDDYTAEVTISKLSLSVTRSKCTIIPISNPRLPHIASFSILNLHFHGLEVYRANLEYVIDLVYSSQSVSQCTLSLYEDSTDTTGTSIPISSQNCTSELSKYNSLTHLVPFETKTTTISSPPIDFSTFTQKTVVTQTSTNLLDYFFQSDSGFCTLNPIKHLDFIEALWGPEYLLPYFEYNITVEREVVFASEEISAFGNYTRGDTVVMVYTDTNDTSQVEFCPCVNGVLEIVCAVCLTSGDEGKTFLLSLENSDGDRVDTKEIRMVTLYPTPKVTALKLYARAHLVNGTYPQYPELEFVEVSVENTNGVDMEKIPLRCRTNILEVELNSTWIDDSSLICKTDTALLIDNFCLELSYNDGLTWFSDCSSQQSLLQTQVDQILWKSQSFYQSTGQKAVRFNVVCFWHLEENIHERCKEVDGDRICTTPVFYEYDVSQSSSSRFVPDAYCDVVSEEDDFSHFETLNNIEWVIPSHIYPSGTREDMRVFGSNFKEISICQFEVETGDVLTTTAIFHDEEFVECPLPDFSSITVTDMLQVLVSLPQSDGSVSFTEKVMVNLINRPIVSSISPTKGFLQQERDIKFTGQHFYNLETLHVKATFEGNAPDMLLDCLTVSNELIIIKSPNAMNIALYEDRRMFLYVSSNGVDYSEESIAYTYMDEPHIQYLTEVEADYEGNIETEAVGLYFTSDVTHCVFGNIYVAGAFNSTSGNVKCVVPPSDRYGAVRFKLIFFNYYEVNNTEIYFTYRNLDIIDDFNPKQGHISGGSTVVITGNFTVLDGYPYQIFFGTEEVTEYTMDSLYQITVKTPPVVAEIDVEVLIHSNGEIYSTESLIFKYKDYFQVIGIYPESGPSRGETVVQVSYTGLITDSIYCAFGDKYSVPVITSMRVHCKTPASSPGSVEVNLLIPGIYITSSDIFYTYNKDISVLEVTPVAVPLEGGTTITVKGLNFLPGVKFKITEFGEVLDISNYISSSEIQFVAPESESTGEKAIFLTNNEEDFYQRYDFPLIYYNAIIVHSISPSKILIGSNTEVVVKGLDFMNDERLLSAIKVNEEIVTTTWVDSETLTAYMPPFPSLTVETEFDVLITINLQDYYTGLSITYILPPVITSFTPTFSNSQEQYFSVNVTGANFLYTSSLKCNLGSYESYTILFESSTSIMCFFSTLPSGDYHLHVSNNDGFDFTVSSQTFEVARSIQVSGTQPKLVTNKGGIMLVQGTGFTSGVKCVFEIDQEGYTFNEDRIVDAKVLSSNLMLCKMPDLSFVGNSDMVIRASLSSDLRLVSESGARFKIVDKAPKGFYVDGTKLVECPEGTYCPGKGFASAVMCPVGTFADKKRSNECKPCNKNLCPFEGLQEALLCPSGYICDSFGMHYPQKPCTAGSFCEAGVDSYDKLNPSIKSPENCDAQSYCETGAKSGIVYSHNSTSAQICKRGYVCPEGSTSAYGIGECPTGHYCPTSGHPGIPCPPRTYCPRRGNLFPIPCPKGTFNYHFGQSNCTSCPVGYICPVEGLFSPITCPPGMICNEEGLSYAYYLCPPGLICFHGVKSGVQLENRSCKMLENIEDTVTKCVGGQVYYQSNEHYGTFLDGYGLNVTAYACCWSTETLMEYIPDIGRMLHNNLDEIDMAKNTTTVEIFYSYAEMFNQNSWHGMKLIEKALFNLEFNDTDTGINIPNHIHKKLLEDYMFWNMYTDYKAELCPGGYFCLEGTYTYDSDDIISTPFICPGGSYCLPGSGTPIGTGFCPAGFYCPEGSENAIPTPPGFFTPTPGATSPIACYPGYFTLNEQSVECSRCPNGFQCKGTGTSWPTICPVGNYRSSSESNACSLCPSGTFSIDRGVKDETECLSCPAGRICSETGLTNITESSSCSDGAVCDEATGARNTITCPKGFYCPSKTGIDDIFSNMCPPGFYCEEGTGDGSKFNKKCPEGYYCPAATESYDEFLGTGDHEQEVATRCPRGTGNDSEDGKRELTECGVDSISTLLTTGDIRIEDEETTTTTRRNLDRRNLQTTSSTTTTLEDKLNDPTEIEMSLHAYLESDGQTTDELTEYINLNREYLTRWNPINTTLNEDIIFTIPALSYAIVTMDLRALKDQYRNFTYYEDWAISFTIDDEITEESRAQPVEMPEMFLRTSNDKNKVLNFQVFAYTEKKMRIDILLYNGLYFNLKYLFLNSTVVQIRSPNRAEFGTEKTFVAILVNEYQVGLPINAPKIQQEDSASLPEYSLTFADNNDYTISEDVMNRVVTERGKNIYVPSSLYWQDRESINLPFLPYFSNCKGFGQYIPIWGITEQHHECTQVTVEETVFMHEYSFRQAPIADACEEITVQCVYDEVWNDDQQSLTRWFEIGAEESIFDFSVSPITAEEIPTKEFSENDVLGVASEGDAGDLDTAPQAIGLGMNYYQYSKTDKLLISIDLSFDELKTLTTAEKDGLIDVPYNLTFSYLALSHTDLTIAFAFEWHFYLVLYLIIGTLSIFIILVFLCYHRIMTRGKAASFKFFSNLKLMLPPAAYGVTISMFPLILINLYIAVFMIGSVLEYNFRLFPCDSEVDTKDCPYSLFDWLKDDPNNVDVDYDLLRSGRAGIAFCIVGIYLMWLGLKILIPEKSDLAVNVIAESYDGNVWEFFTWKRSNVLFISIFWIFYNLMVIQFSFSEIFGTYIWYMIGLIKVFGVILGFILEVLVEEALLSSPLEILGGLTQGLVTFGADDFVDFLNAYFIELGIMMFERTYVGDFVDYCVKYIESRMQKLMNLRWFSSSNDDFLMDKEARKQKEAQERKKREQEEADLLREDKEPDKDDDKKKEENKGDLDVGSSGSDIYISDDEDDFDFDDSDNLDDSDQFLDYNDSFDGDKAKPVEKKDIDAKAGKDEESDLPIDDNIEVQEVEPLLESFKNYANDTIVLFVNPLFIALIWVFYDETQVAAEYGIRTQDFLYYFMFSVVIIPFQIVIDVCFQNIVEWYFRLPVHDYLDYLHFRFASRTTRWKGNEEIPNLQVGVNLVSLDQLCFSSQYYFVQTIYSFGMTQLLLGIQILLNFPDYNAFSDNALLLVIVVTVAVCFLIQRISILLGTLLRIWKVKEKKVKKEEMTLKEQFLRLLNVDQYMKSKGIKLSPVELHFSKAKWDIVEKLRAQDEVALVDLKTDRIVARTVRDKFIRFNKPWLRENMHEIFTPRTLFLYRKEIINQFEKVVGKRQPVNISLSSKEKSTDSKEASDHNDSKYYKNFRPKYMTEKTKEIIRFWINNAKISKLLRERALQNKGMVKSNIHQG